MACGDSNSSGGCGGGIEKKKVFTYNSLKYLLSKLSGKICLAIGSIRFTAERPLHLDKTFDDDGILVNGYIDDVTTSASGLMTADDKVLLDNLATGYTKQGEEIVKIEENIETLEESVGGLTEAEEKLDERVTALEEEISNVGGIEVYVDVPSVLFTKAELEKVANIVVMKDGEKVAITNVSSSRSLSSCSFTSSIEDGVAVLTFSRSAAMVNARGSVVITVTADGLKYERTISVASTGENNLVLQGYVRMSNGVASADLWTFDGSQPTIRYPRTGAIWINLPESWSEVLGTYHSSYMWVHATEGGANGNAYINIGKFSPSSSYNNDQASDDCWAAILLLQHDKDGNRMDAGMYVSVYYCNGISAGVYADQETFGMKINLFSYPTVSGAGGTFSPALVVSKIVYNADGSESEVWSNGDYDVEYSIVTPIGSTLQSIDSATGKITVGSATQSLAPATIGTVNVRVKMTDGAITVTHVATCDITQDVSGTSYTESLDVGTFSYNGNNELPVEGGTFSPTVEFTFIDSSGKENTLSLSDMEYYTFTASDLSANKLDNETGVITTDANTGMSAEEFTVRVFAAYKGFTTRKEITVTQKAEE